MNSEKFSPPPAVVDPILGFLTLIFCPLRPHCYSCKVCADVCEKKSFCSPKPQRRSTHMVFFQTNDEVRTPSQFHFKVFPINVRNPMEKKFLKSNQPFLSYQLNSNDIQAHMAVLFCPFRLCHYFDL